MSFAISIVVIIIAWNITKIRNFIGAHLFLPAVFNRVKSFCLWMYTQRKYPFTYRLWLPKIITWLSKADFIDKHMPSGIKRWAKLQSLINELSASIEWLSSQTQHENEEELLARCESEILKDEKAVFDDSPVATLSREDSGAGISEEQEDADSDHKPENDGSEVEPGGSDATSPPTQLWQRLRGDSKGQRGLFPRRKRSSGEAETPV